MNNKIGRLLKRTAYGFYTLGVFFLIVGMLLSSVTQPALASGDQQLETTEEVWDKSSLYFTGGCQGNCTEVRATVCNGSDSEPMDGPTTYTVFYIASGNPKDGTQVASGEIPALGTGQCIDLTYNPNNVAGEYGFHFDQRPGHPGNDGENAHWSDTCTIDECTIETPKGYLYVEKIVEGGPKEISDFPLFVGNSPITSGSTRELDPGLYTVWETGDPDYVASFSGDCDSSGAVTVVVDDTKECTITNTYVPEEPEYGSLKVVKHVVNDGGGTLEAGDFSLHVTIGGVTDDIQGSEEGNIYGQLEVGTQFSVTEDTIAGYSDSYDGCTGAIEKNVQKVCTITNTYVPEEPEYGSLKVVKHVVNGNGGTKEAGDFSLHVTIGEDTYNIQGSEDGKIYELLEPGTQFSITEDAVVGYKETYNGCTGTIVANEMQTCTVTNIENPPPPPGNANLIVVKVVVGGTKVVSDFPLYIDNNPVVSGALNQVLPGEHKVKEDGDPKYEASFSGDCNDQGKVDVLAGETKVCTITNKYKAPVVTPHTEDPTPQNTLPAPQGTPSQGDPLIPVTGADLSHPGFPAAALPRLALNLGIALLGLAMVFHGASSRFKDEE